MHTPMIDCSNQTSRPFSPCPHRMRDKSRQTDGSPPALFNFFINRVRNQLHVVLAMSPIGDAFRNRLRKFPSLVNCCTIDWFQKWPEDALEVSVTKGCDISGFH